MNHVARWAVAVMCLTGFVACGDGLAVPTMCDGYFDPCGGSLVGAWRLEVSCSEPSNADCRNEWRSLAPTTFHFDADDNYWVETSATGPGQRLTQSRGCFADHECVAPYTADDNGQCTATSQPGGAFTPRSGTYSVGGATVQFPHSEWQASLFCVRGDQLLLRDPVLGGAFRSRFVRVPE